MTATTGTATTGTATAGRATVAALRGHRRAVLRLLAWSVPEAAPAACSGLVVATAVDRGFLAGRPLLGCAVLSVLVVAAAVGALGTGRVNLAMADLVEPVRDDLVRLVVHDAVHRGARLHRDHPRGL